MNITEVKVKLLGSPDKQFGFNHSTDAKGEKDLNWMRMWDNEKLSIFLLKYSMRLRQIQLLIH